MDYVKSSGKPLLLDKTENAKGSFLLDTGVAARLREFRQFSLGDAAPEIAAALLDSDKINFFGDQIFVKEPGTRERTAFHQDATYFKIEGEKCCVLWIPVDPVTLESGTILYVRGSHRDGKLYQLMFLSPRRRYLAPKGSLYPTSKDIWRTTTSSTSTWSREMSSFITIARYTAQVAITAAIRSGAPPLYGTVATISVSKLAPGRRANFTTRLA
jgi:phytanoyl-CoA dioxygenase PhyH